MAANNLDKVINEIEDEEEDEIFEVEKILDMKQRKGKRQFLIRWKSYGENEDSWEPEENLDGAKEIVTNYVKEYELKSSTKKSSKSAKRGHSSTGIASTSSSQKTPRRFSLKDDNSDEEVNDVDYQCKGDEDDVPAKKKKDGKLMLKNSLASQSDCVKKANGSSQSHMDKAVARRQNLSKNMRWIEDSSDESDNREVEDVEINKESKSPSNIVPDSSTDVLKQKIDIQPEITKDISVSPVNDSSFNDSPLKIKIAVKNDQFSQSLDNTINNIRDINGHKDETAKEKKHKKSKKHGRERSPAVPPTSETATVNTAQSLYFTGMYRDEDKNGELCFIALNTITKKKTVFTLEEAHAADSWALCRYFASKAKFSPSGQTVAE